MFRWISSIFRCSVEMLDTISEGFPLHFWAKKHFDCCRGLILLSGEDAAGLTVHCQEISRRAVRLRRAGSR
jgi:hypothetical protein